MEYEVLTIVHPSETQKVDLKGNPNPEQTPRVHLGTTGQYKRKMQVVPAENSCVCGIPERTKGFHSGTALQSGLVSLCECLTGQKMKRVKKEKESSCSRQHMTEPWRNEIWNLILTSMKTMRHRPTYEEGILILLGRRKRDHAQ